DAQAADLGAGDVQRGGLHERELGAVQPAAVELQAVDGALGEARREQGAGPKAGAGQGAVAQHPGVTAEVLEAGVGEAATRRGQQGQRAADEAAAQELAVGQLQGVEVTALEDDVLEAQAGEGDLVEDEVTKDAAADDDGAG